MTVKLGSSDRVEEGRGAERPGCSVVVSSYRCQNLRCVAWVLG